MSELDVLAVLRQLVDQVDRLERRQRAVEQAVIRLIPAAAIDDVEILAVIDVFVRGDEFTTAELIAKLVEHGRRGYAVLQAKGLADPRRLGNFLERLEGKHIAGFNPHRTGRDRDGVIWRIAKESNESLNPNSEARNSQRERPGA